MDVLIQTHWDNPYGGSTARRWSGCVDDNPAWHGEYFPFATGIMDLHKTVGHYEAAPNISGYNPGKNNLGVMFIGKGEIPSNVTTTYEHRATTQTKMKDFIEARNAGKIVLNPMWAHKITATASPQIITERLIASNMQMRVWGLANGLVGNPPGRCGNTRHHPVPQLELDVRNADICARFSKYKVRDVLSADKYVTQEAIRVIRRHFNNVPVNNGLVTTTVAEANAQTFDLLTELGEMPETIKMIVNFVIEGVKLLLRAKRSIKNLPNKALKSETGSRAQRKKRRREKETKQQLSSGSVRSDAASQWMGYRYGLMPIVYSINDLLDLLELDAKRFQSFRGRRDTEQTLPDIGDYKFVSSSKIEERVFVKYGYELESRVRGLKLNVASTAWELLPLSFVFDWFFQVADTLTAMQVPNNVNQRAASFSKRWRGEVKWVDKLTHSELVCTVDMYDAQTINTQDHIGLNSEVFVGFKRKLDALSLYWLMFKKKPRG